MENLWVSDESSVSSIESYSFYVRTNPLLVMSSEGSSEMSSTVVQSSLNQGCSGIGFEIQPNRGSVFTDFGEQKLLRPIQADSPGGRILKESRQSVRLSQNIPTRVFCRKCGKENLTEVRFEYGGLWNRVQSFFQQMKCCGEPNSGVEYQEAVHSCGRCGYMVARVKGGR